MFLYTEKYTESKYDIQNNNFFYKIGQQCQNMFVFVFNIGAQMEHFQKLSKQLKTQMFILYYV